MRARSRPALVGDGVRSVDGVAEAQGQVAAAVRRSVVDKDGKVVGHRRRADLRVQLVSTRRMLQTGSASSTARRRAGRTEVAHRPRAGRQGRLLGRRHRAPCSPTRPGCRRLHDRRHRRVRRQGPSSPARRSVFFDTPTAQRLLQPHRQVQRDHRRRGHAVSANGAAQPDRQGAPAGMPRRSPAPSWPTSRPATSSRALGFFNTFLLVFALIALFVGAFIIFNTFSMLVAQRTRELALMRALGASRGQVTRAVLLEAVVVGLLASAIGLVAGIGVALGPEGAVRGVRRRAAGRADDRGRAAHGDRGVRGRHAGHRGRGLMPARRASRVATGRGDARRCHRPTGPWRRQTIVGTIVLRRRRARP